NLNQLDGINMKQANPIRWLLAVDGHSWVVRALCVVGGLLGASSSPAQSIVRIEEDWELHVVQPDVQMDAPQIRTTLLPFGDASDLLFQIDINHASFPSFQSGGLQIRVCTNDECLAEERLFPEERLNTTAE